MDRALHGWVEGCGWVQEGLRAAVPFGTIPYPLSQLNPESHRPPTLPPPLTLYYRESKALFKEACGFARLLPHLYAEDWLTLVYALGRAHP